MFYNKCEHYSITTYIHSQDKNNNIDLSKLNEKYCGCKFQVII